jgi:hypothetical protein
MPVAGLPMNHVDVKPAAILVNNRIMPTDRGNYMRLCVPIAAQLPRFLLNLGKTVRYTAESVFKPVKNK